MKKIAIIGHPLKHSLSPRIHNAAFNALDMEAYYLKRDIPPQDFDKAVRHLKNEPWNGFNVTIPFKKAVLAYLDSVDALAEKIGAVNTIAVEANGKWRGYNTDYEGFLRPLQKENFSLQNCLILGAGGAARAVAFGLAETFNCKKMTFINRTLHKAQVLAADLQRFYQGAFTVQNAEELRQKGRRFDLIVNTTALGMGLLSGLTALDVRPFAKPESLIYDLIYNPQKTKFLELAEKNHLQTVNGWPMLLFQAAASFKIWTGQNFPDTVLQKFLSQKN